MDKRKKIKWESPCFKMLKHRGPDWSGLYQHGDCYLAHQRLAIIDPASGDQPLFNEDKSIVVTVNGEIYNHEELRKKLAHHKFRTGSDCDVIAHLYEEYGEDFVDMLDGIFSFVLLDTRDNSFVVARDAIGVTSLYIGWGLDGSPDLKAAKEVADYLGTVHHEFHFTVQDGIDAIEDVIYHIETYDVTTIRASTPMFLMSRKIKSLGVKMVISGEGSDEIFGGYLYFHKAPDKDEFHRETCRKSVWISSELKGLNDDCEHFESFPPGHLYSSKSGGFRRWYNPPWFSEAIPSVPYDPLVLRRAFENAVTKRLMTDVPFGVLLSGGLDSSLVASITARYLAGTKAAKQWGAQLHSFCVGLEIKALHQYDCLRANKATSAWGLEARVPFLDKEFINVAMSIDPEAKMIKKDEGRIEKWVLRRAFDDEEHPYLPKHILYRQKEQFSDGVGYSWIDGLKAHAARHVTDKMMFNASFIFPHNTPTTKEAYYYRMIFERFFPQNSARLTVPGGASVACSTAKAVEWDAAWKNNLDPSGRAALGVHLSAYDAETPLSNKPSKVIDSIPRMDFPGVAIQS
ncbi:hypothetical protein GOBAR_AA29275 [Gossypium barbadense]|uniref:Asparagine synthetase [glutamine-hydrolyzing] n=1 Tax=Gossypium barbadense TaxID=3634 RepID=A0A2P5WK14_GOSBA|nr:hypothetical protein GOBAR_AA29275 [Gossypium barbadense]